MLAEELFDPETIAGHYARLLGLAAQRRRVEVGHWVPEVPASAYRAVVG